MEKIRTLIIDDEPKAIEIIERYCLDVAEIDLKGTFRNPLEALKYLNNHSTDLIFLDINMPKLNGMDLLDLVETKPAVVFTTAYSEYALDSYEYDALDYLLKPISFRRFMKSIHKFKKQIEPTLEIPNEDAPKSDKIIYIKSGTQTHRLSIDDIIYLEKDGNYLIFHTQNRKILSRQNMKDIFEILNPDNFIRIHKSFVIAKKHIEIIETTQVIIASKKLPIGRNYKDNVDRLLNN